MKSEILLINKPFGITSSKILQLIKKKLGVKKIGHAGTLDPMATGLLVAMTNDFTKFSNFLSGQSKCYYAEIKLFVETDTGDMEGQIIKIQNPFFLSFKRVKNVLERFQSLEYCQQVPLFSAVKINGKKLYEYARKKEEIEVIPSRNVNIYNIRLISYDSEKGVIKFEVECSKGTYIRALVRDIVLEMEVLGTLYRLKRTKSGYFSVADSLNFEDFLQPGIK